MTVAELCSRHGHGERRLRQPAWHWRTFGYMLILLCFISGTSSTNVGSESRNNVNSQSSRIRSVDCQLVSQKYLAMNLPVLDVERMPLMGTHLKVCPTAGKTCCGDKMEKKLIQKAKIDNSKVFRDKQLQLGTLLSSRTKALQDFFRKLFDTSYNELNSMFSRTYGYQYQANKGLITNLFTELRKYHPGKVNFVKPILNNFFKKLFSKMFILINRQYDFKSNYMNCAERKLAQFKPFGDKAELLIQQLTRAFVTTRTFMQGLQVANIVLSNVESKVKLSQECTNAMTRLRYCNLCAGQPNAKPCPNFCLNVVNGCFAKHALLQKHWGKFIDTLSRTADTVSGPFNIKVIVKPLGFKISDAIMVFQNNQGKILKEVKKMCGGALIRRPDTPNNLNSRQKRQVRQGGRGSRGNSGTRGTRTNFGWRYDENLGRASGGDLGRLVKETTAALKRARNIWTSLPNSLCSGDRVAAASERCWNGTTVSSYSRPLSTVSSDNPEINNRDQYNRADPVIQQSIILLKDITAKLDKATKGEEVVYMKIDTPMARRGTAGSRSQNRNRNSLETSGDGELEGSGAPQTRPQPPRPRPRPRPQPQPVTTRRPVLPTPDPDVEGSGDSESSSSQAPVVVTTAAPTRAPPLLVTTKSRKPILTKGTTVTVSTATTATTTTTTMKPTTTTVFTTTKAALVPKFPDAENSGDGEPIRPGPEINPGTNIDVEGSGSGNGNGNGGRIDNNIPIKINPPTNGPGRDRDIDAEGSGSMIDKGLIDPGVRNPDSIGTGTGRGDPWKDETIIGGGGTDNTNPRTNNDPKLWLKPKDGKGGAEKGEGSPNNPVASKISKTCEPPHCAGTVARSTFGWLTTLLAVLLSGLLGALVAA